MAFWREGGLWLLGYREVPFAVRGLYRRELFHMMGWGIAWGALNGPYCGFVAAKSLHAPDILVGLIVSSIALANLFALWWGGVVARRSKRLFLIPGIVVLALALFTFVGTGWLRRVDDAFGILPAPGRSAWTVAAVVFTVQVILCWVLIQAVNTVRTAIWRLNYPATHRGRILARFGIWQMLLGAITSALAGAYYDGRLSLPWGGPDGPAFDLRFLPYAGSPDAYRAFFPLIGVLVLISALFYRRFRVRGERTMRAEPEPPPDANRHGGIGHPAEAGYSLPAWFQMIRRGVFSGFRDAARIFREDPRFTEYLWWQMVAGTGKMLLDVPIIIILNEVFGVSYISAAALLSVVPQVFVMLTTPLWSVLFDRWALLRFRTAHMLVWVVSRLILALGVWQQSLLLIGVCLALEGAAFGAGRLSWQLGHMSFARVQDDAIYMGLHQALTGVRGLIIPLVGALLYRHVCGWHVVWVSLGIMAVSAWGFWWMHRRHEASQGKSR